MILIGSESRGSVPNTSPNVRDMAQVSCCQLDEEEFQRCCLQIWQRSEELRDGWSWQQLQGSEDGYLKKTTLRCVSVTSKLSEKNQQDSSLLIDSDCRQNQSAHVAAAPEEAADVADDEDVADVADVPACSACESSFLQFEYHVVFSCSYSSPVLYFRAFTLEGRSLTLEEVWSSIHPNFRLRLQESPLNAVSQQEHPLLGQPFFLLHPCRTEEFMKPLLQMAQQHHRSVNYVLSWLSIVGPVVGLHVPLQYFSTLCVKDPASISKPG